MSGTVIDVEVGAGSFGKINDLTCMRSSKAMFGGACMCLSLLIGLIIFLCSIHQLGPDDQLLLHNEQGKEVVNGPGTQITNPFRSLDWRKAIRLGPLEYALVEDTLTGIPHHVEGPTLLFLEAYDVHKGSKSKVVLKKDEYINLVDAETGKERVLRGPLTFVPTPTEQFPKGKQQAVLLDTDSAVLVLDKTTGMQKLVVEQGVFVPDAYQEVVEIRSLIHVLPHEALVEKDASGLYIIHGGSDAFFLQPYHELVSMIWSSYSDPIESSGDLQAHKTVQVTKIDMRARMMFFAYEVRTNDNVKLRLDGNIFWRVTDIQKLIETTSDPEGEVWQHARSALIQGVSKVTLSVFMARINNISTEAFETQATDGFYGNRGVEIVSMEVTRYEPVDERTAEVLQEIIQETTNRINKLQVQNSENDVMAAKLAADIQMEKQRTELIQMQSKNHQLQSQMKGESDGMKRARNAKAFIDGISSSLPNATKQVELYELHERLDNNRANAKNLASGNAKLFLTPEDMKLKLQMGGGHEL